MRLAVIIKERCNPAKCGLACVKVCPINRTGKDCVYINKETNKAVIDESLCTGCGLCVKKCPLNAIIIVNLPERLEENPFHRYGSNGFALYRIPEPEKGVVLGLIGRNGIGKSTALKLLSGVLKPNLGLERFSSIEDVKKQVLKHLRGSKAQAFFEALFKGAVKTVYKVQRIELVARKFQGSVKEFLEKASSDKEKILNTCKSLGIEHLMLRQLSTLSGGELQRVVIAFTALKDANFKFIDEPSSYLDIKQRVNTAKFIKQLSKDSAIVVVDHDLLMLDYMADYVQVLYGTPHAFGIVSKPMQAKAGINAYLEGYLRDLNVRFREKPIDFKTRKQSFKSATPCVEWPEFEVALNGFTLKVETGVLFQNEIIGIVGENGIGKSTFAKALAGLLNTKPELRLNVSIAYKPQYLEVNNNVLVKEFLKGWEAYKHLLKPFELEPLMNQELSTLSGGELQRVFIARALTREADLVLLDEPSAYLDIEQRLQLGKIVRDLLSATNSSALIIDHDLLFLTQISDRVLVFQGEPGLQGFARSPLSVEEAMNEFLKMLNITVRRDSITGRPRINKPESVLDKKQREKNTWFG